MGSLGFGRCRVEGFEAWGLGLFEDMGSGT